MESLNSYLFSLLILGCIFCLNSALSTPEHQSFNEFAKEMLARHNEHRKIHNDEGTDLILSKKLNKEASDLATAAARNSDVLENPGPGQNIFMACSTYNRALTGKEVTDSWYDEVCHPNFKFSNPDNKQARSFTQVVWKNSKELGVGHAVTRKEHTMCTYVIAIYKPSGNVLENFGENVLQGKFRKEEYCKKPNLEGVDMKRTGLKEKKKSAFKDKNKNKNKNKNKKEKVQFKLNKNPQKPTMSRRTLYYKIPVNFVTASDTGSTIVLPRAQQFREDSAYRRSEPMQPESAPSFDPDSIRYNELGSERSQVKSAEVKSAEVKGSEDKSYLVDENSNNENGDVQADYIREQLDQQRESISAEDKARLFQQNLQQQEEQDVPAFENLQMVNPERKTIEDDYAVNKAALAIHNALRKIHNSPPLKLSPKMSISSENYARFLAESNRFEHAKKIGENLAFSCNKEERIPSVAEAIKDWYQEVCLRDYDFDKDPSTPGTAHFSQIIWQSTKLFGIGRAIIRRGDQTCTYFVARYDPPGNYIGQFEEQVKKGSFSKQVCKNLDKIIKEAVGNVEGGNVELGTTVKPPTKENKNKTKLLSENIFKQLKGGECLMGSINDQAHFAGQALKVHNYFRKMHKSPPLEINEELVRQALESVKQACMKATKRGEIAGKVGENVGTGCNFLNERVSAAEAVTNWYRQVCDKGYQFGEEATKIETAKFTQLVWRKTTKFGIAFATKKRKDGLFCTYIVAKYSPIGNSRGSYVDNVRRGSFTPSICESLNTVAFNAVNDGKPSAAVNQPQTPHTHWSFVPKVANQVLNAVSHEAAKYVPFKFPTYHDLPLLKPATLHAGPLLIHHNKRCKFTGTLNAACRAEIEDEGLRIHNYFRKVHGAKDLKLSPALSLSASHYASTLLQQKNIRNSDSKAGESIAVKCREPLTVGDAIKTWYKEVCLSNYDFTAEGLQGSGHFTQIVWKETELLGIGKATATVDGVPCTVVVARYEPAGNVIGKFRANVKHGEFTKKFCKTIDQIIDTPKADKADSFQPASGQVPVDTTAANQATVVQGAQVPTAANQGAVVEGAQVPAAASQGAAAPPAVHQGGAENVAAGQSVTGQENAGQAVTGTVAAGEAVTGQSAAGATAQNAGGQGASGQVAAGQIAADQESSSQNAAAQQAAVQGAAGQSAAGQGSAGQAITSEGMAAESVANPAVKLPNKNKGINPKAAQKHPSKTMKGETKPGAKQEGKKPVIPLKKPATVLSLGQMTAKLASPESATKFNKEGLKVHNALRNLHGSGELKSTPQLVMAAQKRCKNIIESGTVTQARRRSVESKAGENMVIMCDAMKTEYSAKDAIMKWYGEVCDRKEMFIHGAYGGIPNHFTQIVWISSKQFGMAKTDFKDKTSGDYCSCIMSLYQPAGNFIGKVKTNVKKGKFDESTCENPDEILRVAEAKYAEKQRLKALKQQQAATAPPVTQAPTTAAPTTAAPTTVVPTTAAPTQPQTASAGTTAGPPGSPAEDDGMPTPTPITDLDASPTPATQVTFEPPTTPPGTTPGVQSTKPQVSTLPTTPGPPAPPGVSPSATPKPPGALKPTAVTPSASLPASQPSQGTTAGPQAPTQAPVTTQVSSPAPPAIPSKTKPVKEKERKKPAGQPGSQGAAGGKPAGQKVSGKAAAGQELGGQTESAQGAGGAAGQGGKAAGQKEGVKTAAGQKPAGQSTGAQGAGGAAGQGGQAAGEKPEGQSLGAQGAGGTGGKGGKAAAGQKPAGQSTGTQGAGGAAGQGGKAAAGEKPEGQSPGAQGAGDTGGKGGQAAAEQKPAGQSTGAQGAGGAAGQGGKAAAGQKQEGQSPGAQGAGGTGGKGGQAAAGQKPGGQEAAGLKPGAQIPVGGKPAGQKGDGKNQPGQGTASQRPEGATQTGQGPEKGGPPTAPGASKVGDTQPTKRPSQTVASMPTTLKTKTVSTAPTKRPEVNGATAVMPTTIDTQVITTGPTKSPAVNAATMVKPGQAAAEASPTTLAVAATPVPTTIASTLNQGGEYEKAGLEAHNKLRAIHTSPNLALDGELSKACAEYAKVLAEKGTLQHSDSKDGENLAMGCSTKNVEMSAVQATRNWYREACSPGYKFGESEPSHGTGHFTQAVWKGSKIFGIGRFTKEDKTKNMFCTYIVGRYRPAGNWAGQYVENVPKGTFNEKTCDDVDKIVGLTKKASKKTTILNARSNTGRAPILTKKTAIVDEEEEHETTAQDRSYYLL